MPTIIAPGATLSYTLHTTSPTNPLLLLIPGGQGDASLFPACAHLLSKNFSVITYDRRGYSGSTLTGEQDYTTPGARLSRDADDAALLIQHVQQSTGKGEGEGEVYVFGTSSGAIVAQQLLLRHAGLLTSVLLHEPPLAQALGEEMAAGANAANGAVVAAWRAQGIEAAAKVFLSIYGQNAEDAALFERLMNEEGRRANTEYLMEYEMVQYTGAGVDWEGLRGVGGKLVIGIGEVAREMGGPLGMVVGKLEEGTGARVVVLPGTHFVYYLMPEEFAEAMVGVFLR